MALFPVRLKDFDSPIQKTNCDRRERQLQSQLPESEGKEWLEQIGLWPGSGRCNLHPQLEKIYLGNCIETVRLRLVIF